MSLKTEYQYNEDDFVQRGESLNELTVTITLCEYRNLIREQTRSAERIDFLEEKLKETKEMGKTFMQLFMLKSPETINKLCDLYNEFFPNKTEEGEEDEQMSNEGNND